MKQKTKEMIYAGFFTRLLATLVDIFIVSLILSIVRFAIDAKSIVLLVVVWWLYTTVMHIKWRTTIGGKLFGIEVLDSEQELLSFKSASLRFIVSITPFLLYILFRGMQHDMTLTPSPTVQQLPQLLFFLPPLLMLFTQKKQMIHDLLVHSIVVDTSEIKRAEKEGKKSVGYVAQKTLRIGGTLLFLTLIGYLVLYVSVFYTIGKQSYDSNNVSYEKKYTVNDYNDSRIIFYNQELEKHSEEFVQAKSMYKIFEADVEKDLALNCIQYYLKEHNDTDWISTGSNFRKNARNKYTTTKEKVKNAKRNESYMGKNFYVYELNDVNDLEDSIADKWSGKDANKETCQIQLSSEEMYALFLPKYVARYTRNLNRAIIDGNEALKDHRVKQEKWLKEVTQSCKACPPYETYSQRFINGKRDAENRLFAIAKGERPSELDNGFGYSSKSYKINFNVTDEEGKTPLFYLINSRDAKRHLNYFIRMKTDLHHKDKYGKTVFEYINKDTPSYVIRMLNKAKREASRQIETPNKMGEKEGVLNKKSDDRGQWKEEPHVDGKKHGVVKHYDKNRLQMETPYRHDKKHGIEKAYEDNGKLNFETPYVDGKRHGIEKIYRNGGKVIEEIPYINGKKHGLSKMSSKNGKLLYEITYKDGKPNGFEREYYSNGSIMWEQLNENGMPVLGFEHDKKGNKVNFEYDKNRNKIILKKRDSRDYKIYDQDVKRGVPPIFAAIQNHLHKELLVILASGADMEMKNKFGDTPLRFALKQRDDKLVKILLEHGANPNVINGRYSPLTSLLNTNRVSTVKLFLKHGVDVNYQYNKGETALTEASKGCKNFDMVKLLLYNGADPTLMDKFGFTTKTGLFRYCRKDANYEKMMNLLENYKKDVNYGMITKLLENRQNN